ncbi:two-component system, response regulator YesN [Paenibacillus polysaccharolyticus]|uniref:Two-component system, response regulator YesN n=1 Tax=Paenibacillus polysaccharolyticus TaxID=582692 RepID=A0A1G5L7Q1_9BACL|nr:response regulator [Paenibacillus polysaccharolyticus]SCZ08358.1 two-component system, response regulator YesN [Paenibacillus polysaccharolyticus]
MEPLKVLLVDDEYLIRNLLRMRIDWQEQGMQIVGEACDAAEALEQVELLHPDIVFTDIYMPKMDGIELSGLILKRYPNIKIVVVTGHDEFEYARQSVKLGISDFILKPIRSTELLQVTAKLREAIEQERGREYELTKLRKEMKRSLPYLKERFVNQWLQGMLNEEEVREQLHFYGIPIAADHPQSRVAIIEIQAASPSQAETSTEEVQILMRMDGLKHVQAYYQQDIYKIIVMDTHNRIVILATHPDAKPTEQAEQLLGELRCLLKVDGSEADVTIGIGQLYSGWESVCIAYREACRALDYQTFVGKNQVIFFEDLVIAGAKQSQPYRSDKGLLEQLQFCISVGAEEEAVSLLRQILAAPFFNTAQFRMAAMDVITECQRVVMEQQLEDEQVFNQEAVAVILMSEHLPDLRRMLEQHVRAISGVIKAKRQAKEVNLIDQVKAYLEEQMSNAEVGLSSTAAAFYVSPGHLGRLMKKETGQTFVEYLTQLRMKKAESLLKQTDLKGYEIGEQVGIPDPQYFSVLFKKQFGRSMNEYRNVRN